MRIILAAMGLLLGTAAVAQDSAPDIAIAAARNQQGLLEYCAEQGHVGPDAPQTQAGVIASFPPPRDAAMVEDAYRKGRAGIVSAMNIEQPLAEAAAAQATTPGLMCAELVKAAEQAARQLPQ